MDETIEDVISFLFRITVLVFFIAVLIGFLGIGDESKIPRFLILGIPTIISLIIGKLIIMRKLNFLFLITPLISVIIFTAVFILILYIFPDHLPGQDIGVFLWGVFYLIGTFVISIIISLRDYYLFKKLN